MRMGYHKRKGNQTLSFELTKAIQETVGKRQSILVLVKQRGLARFSMCAKCRSVLRCPNCQNALTEMKSGYYHCLNCSYRSGLFPSCPQCKEMQFTSFGAGTDAVLRELSKVTRAPFFCIDRDAQKHKKGFDDLVRELQGPAPLFVVSTYEAAESLPLEPFHLIAMIEPDQGLFYPDYMSEERLWRSLHRFGGKLATDGKLLVQTFEPESKHWTTWIHDSPVATAKSFLEERQALRYPPYFNFVQIECVPTEKETSEAVAERITLLFQPFKKDQIEMLPKYIPFSRNKNYHLLIRYPMKKTMHQSLLPFLNLLDPTVKITHNPVSLHG